jgi:hypothetical protein
MKTQNQKNRPRNIQVSMLGLALAAAAVLPHPAAAHDRREGRAVPEVHGRVEVVREVPGGTVSVGVEVGRPRPQVVVVEQPRPVVIVHQEERCPRQVTVVRHEPVREVTVIHEKHRTIILKRDDYGRLVKTVVWEKHGRGHGNHGRGHDYEEVRYGRGSHDSYDSYEDEAGNTYEARADEHGTYRYYEDARGVSIHEVHDGQSRNVYVRN